MLALDEDLEKKRNLQQVNLSLDERRVLYFHSKLIEKTTGYHWMAMQELILRAISTAQQIYKQTVSDCRCGPVEGQIKMVDHILDSLQASLSRITNTQKIQQSLHTLRELARNEIIEKLVAS